ncbi:hypothetical protein ACOME3_010294 [Neoechinorhynchus agilis]
MSAQVASSSSTSAGARVALMDPWSAANDGGSAEGAALMFERTRIQMLATEREFVQKKTFTNWINSYLIRCTSNSNQLVKDLYIDLRDGRLLLRLLDLLSGERLQRPTRGKMRIHCLENVDKALSFLSEQHVHLENIGAHDIVDGNPSLTLGLVWTIILRFQIQDIRIEEAESSEMRSAKDALLLWCQISTASYDFVNVKNFTSSWRDGLAFNALIHRHRPDLIPNIKSLVKTNAIANLEQAFEIAERKLGVARLLDPEDVIVEFPDEKSIITYVVTLYHYFSKMRADSVQGKRITKVISCAASNERRLKSFRLGCTELLKWINQMIKILDQRRLANSLKGVQQQLFQFNNYRMYEKPSKFEHRGRLEIELFTIQSRMKANNEKPLQYNEAGAYLAEVQSAWQKLEIAEHNREVAIHEEILRQQRLEQLAEKFGRKASMREKWLHDSQKLVASDRFGDDLISVEAAFKKQEAIQTDIAAFQDRLSNLVALAKELDVENYHQSDRVMARKQTIILLWEYLLELVNSRRKRLEREYSVHKILAEANYILKWIGEIENALQREDINKHLMRVDDLLQTHDLLKADISVVGERVSRLMTDAEPFLSIAGYTIVDEESMGRRLADQTVMQEKLDLVNKRYQVLTELSMYRDGKLQEGRTIWQLLDDVTIEEVWVNDKISEITYDSNSTTADWSSVQSQLNRQKALMQELEGRQNQFEKLVSAADDVSSHYCSDVLRERVTCLGDLWNDLWAAANEREVHLIEAIELQQFHADADEANGWMLEIFRLVSSEDYGKDETSAQNALKKHEELMQALDAHKAADSLLSERSLETASKNAKAEETLTKLKRRFDELCELANLRKQKLLDAITLFQLLHDCDNVEAWIGDKERFLGNLAPSAADDIEQLEVMRHRFDGLEREMNASASKVAMVNEMASELMNAEHPNSQDIVERLKQINNKWEDLKIAVDLKREEIKSTFGVQTFHIECDETITWIQDKVKIVQSTEELGRDLSGVMTMQRRLSGIERDLGAIQAKLDQLDTEAEQIEQAHPQEAENVRQKIGQISSVWYELKDILKRREESMGEAAVLQKFLRDLDHFSSWLTKTQTLVASEDIPESLTAAEQMLNKHQSIKEEIDRYAPDYSQMREYGQRVIRDADTTDPQYVFLRERLNALDDGWNELDQMWHQKQNMLSEAMHFQMFERDARATEFLLNNQEYYLQKSPLPRSLEDAEGCIRKHEDFFTSLSASEEKIQSVWQFAQRLCHENHYAADKIMEKAHAIVERFTKNKKGAAEIQEKLRDSLKFFQFVQDCDDLKEWLEEKTVQAQADTYRDSHNIHSKYLKHQAFSAEIAANRERLEALKDSGQALFEEKPDIMSSIEQKVAQLDEMWSVLETTTREKGEKLFDANRGALYEQCISDVDRFVCDLERQFVSEDFEKAEALVETQKDVAHAESLDSLPGDLTRTNIMLTRQALIENEFSLKKQQVEQLKEQAEKLKMIEPERSEQIDAQRKAIEQKFLAMQGPLLATKQRLSLQKRLHQFLRDVEDEKMWIAEKMLNASSCDYGDSLVTVWMQQRKNVSIIKEVDTHTNSFNQLKVEAESLSIDVPHRTAEFNEKIEQLNELWLELLGALWHRKNGLEESSKLHQFLSDVSEAEIWLGEQELMIMSDDCGRDEVTTSAYMRKYASIQAGILDFNSSIDDFMRRANTLNSVRALVACNNLKQLYKSLGKFSVERNKALHARNRLHMLRREVDDFGQWVREKEMIADNPELGVDFDHVSMLCERFKAFEYETKVQCEERMTTITELCENFIREQHEERAVIAQWNQLVINQHQDLLELVRTRGQLLQASFELQKYFHDSREALSLIAERVNSLSDHLGKDARAVFALLRKHANFERDLTSVNALVSSIQAQSLQLIDLYAGPKADQIKENENSVLSAWNNLQRLVFKRKRDLQDCADMHRFFNMARDLTIWVENILRQMKTGGRPARDVSGIDLLMNNHQALRADIDAREENFTICINLGKDLLSRKHQRSVEIKEKCVQLCLLRDRQASEWDERWEQLQLELEVYQFARDAAVAEAWLVTQESYLQIDELGENLDQVENLIRKHEAFEKSIIAQEDRFNALKNLTTLEKREQQPPREPRPLKLNYYLNEFRTWDEKELEGASSTHGNGHRQNQQNMNNAQGTVGVNLTDSGAVLDPDSYTSSSEYIGISDGNKQGVRTPPVKVGFLAKKHLFESTNQRASNRSWERVYAVLKKQFQTDGVALPKCSLELYKDQKQYLNARKGPEDVWNLNGSNAEQAIDYHKRPYVLRVTMANGAVYLFSAHNQNEMNEWIDVINRASREASTGVVQLRPAVTTISGTVGGASNVVHSAVADSRSRSLPSHDHRSTTLASTSGDKRRTTKKEKKTGQGLSSGGGFFSIRKK